MNVEQTEGPKWGVQRLPLAQRPVYGSAGVRRGKEKWRKAFPNRKWRYFHKKSTKTLDYSACGPDKELPSYTPVTWISRQIITRMEARRYCLPAVQPFAKLHVSGGKSPIEHETYIYSVIEAYRDPGDPVLGSCFPGPRDWERTRDWYAAWEVGGRLCIHGWSTRKSSRTFITWIWVVEMLTAAILSWIGRNSLFMFVCSVPNMLRNRKRPKSSNPCRQNWQERLGEAGRLIVF